jgi:uncharacterized protein (DUF2252 family)
MAVSAFAYYRGSALVMAADLAALPRTPLAVQLCGDAHLSNLGLFGAPDRSVVFDVNDFDETHPGPFEWDVKRLAASVEKSELGLWYDRVDQRSLEAAVNEILTGKLLKAVTKREAKARRDVERAVAKGQGSRWSTTFTGSTSRYCRTTGRSCWVATRSSTSPTRWSGSAASGYWRSRCSCRDVTTKTS